MICLVFPKPFEASAFILSGSSLIEELHRIDDWLWEMKLNKRKILIRVINESDFMFFQKLSSLSNEHQYILIGSCGLLKKSKREIPFCELCGGYADAKTDLSNYIEKSKDVETEDIKEDTPRTTPNIWDPVIITSAKKYDRGELISHNCGLSTHEKFVSRLAKQEEIKLEMNDIMTEFQLDKSIEINRIHSNNFLMNSILIPTNMEDDDYHLFDMETYDFIRYSLNFKLKILCVIRVVSDIIGEDQELTRCLPNMGKTIRLMNRILNRVYPMIGDEDMNYSSKDITVDYPISDDPAFIFFKKIIRDKIIRVTSNREIDNITNNLINDYCLKFQIDHKVKETKKVLITDGEEFPVKLFHHQFKCDNKYFILKNNKKSYDCYEVKNKKIKKSKFISKYYDLIIQNQIEEHQPFPNCCLFNDDKIYSFLNGHWCNIIDGRKLTRLSENSKLINYPASELFRLPKIEHLSLSQFAQETSLKIITQ